MNKSCWIACLLLACALWFTVPSAWAQNGDGLPVVAVLDLEAVGATKVEAVAVTERLREVLLKTGRFTLADRGQIEAVLDEQALQQTGCTTQECAVQVGRILGVRQLVTGKIVKVSDDLWLVAAQMIDVETAQTLAAESLRHRGSLFDILDSLLPRLGAKLAGMEPSSLPATVRSTPAAPPPRNGPRVLVLPAHFEGNQAQRAASNNDNVVEVLVQELQDQGATVAYSYYPLGDPAPYDALKSHSLYEDIGSDTWTGVFSKDPDEAFINRVAQELKVDAVLFYRVRAERESGRVERRFELQLWDIAKGRHLQRRNPFDANSLGPAMRRALRQLLKQYGLDVKPVAGGGQ